MLYVLDLDDTLFLERDYVRSGFKSVENWLSKNLDVDNFFNLAWQVFESGQRGDIFDVTLKELGVEEDGLISKLIQVYRRHTPDIKLFPDAEEFISKIDSQSLAIITDGYSIAQWKKIRALNLESKIGRIIITDDLGKDYWKPNPEAFITIQGSLSPEQCVYIADNPIKDFIAPKEIGWFPSIRIRQKGSLYFDLSTPEGCREVTSFYELI